MIKGYFELTYRTEQGLNKCKIDNDFKIK